MRHVLPLLAALSAACAPALPGEELARGAPAVVRVATWNVHDLFDEHDQLLPPGSEDLVLTPPEVEAKLDRVAAVLDRVGADVVLLQEVENAPLLARLAARTGYPEARLVEGNDPRGIDVALLSRLPVLAYVTHRGERDGAGRLLWPRDCTEAHLDLGGGRRLALAGTHLSSSLSDDGTRRALQAARLREIADGLAAAADLAIAGGDLNDEAGSAALAPLLGDGVWLDPAAASLPAEEAWTWSGGGSRKSLDHLVLRRMEVGEVERVEIAGGADVAAASDHRPVILDLSVR
ncbi:MAG TPA: endonuclease/exonuclease/phosphatase family protein [Anaeromyxobacter sp.]|nr:endonuclease/exonuclease/phosphatase family protein [Anaeromyxobacter sp.]